jgi:hypothetical protein
MSLLHIFKQQHSGRDDGIGNPILLAYYVLLLGEEEAAFIEEKGRRRLGEGGNGT